MMAWQSRGEVGESTRVMAASNPGGVGRETVTLGCDSPSRQSPDRPMRRRIRTSKMPKAFRPKNKGPRVAIQGEVRPSPMPPSPASSTDVLEGNIHADEPRNGRNHSHPGGRRKDIRLPRIGAISGPADPETSAKEPKPIIRRKPSKSNSIVLL